MMETEIRDREIWRCYASDPEDGEGDDKLMQAGGL